MRKVIAAGLVATTTLVAGAAFAADIPYYPPKIEIPPVDKDLGGSFYLRGSVAGNVLKGREVDTWDCPPGCGAPVSVTFPITEFGYGYSFGVGAGFETGTGLRFDATVDYLANRGATMNRTGSPDPSWDGDYELSLRSTVLLANAYYDFPLSGGYGHGGYSVAGGMFGYVGAGAGLAFNDTSVTAPATAPGAAAVGGTNTSLAAAGMAGFGYDFGTVVADLGYRALYISDITNGAPPPEQFSSQHNWVHEVRGTVRYRF